MIDLCGNMSGDATPRFSALWGLWSMPIKSWFCRYEFMVLTGRKGISIIGWTPNNDNALVIEALFLFPPSASLHHSYRGR
jgi:hypothetical protein